MKNYNSKKVYFLSIRTWIHASTKLFPQFLMYPDEIDMIYHAWMEYDSLKISVDGMNGLDFGGKTVGPVLFSTACISPGNWPEIKHHILKFDPPGLGLYCYSIYYKKKIKDESVF